MHITNWGVRGREGEGKGGGGGDGSHKKKGGWVGYTSGSSKSYLGDFSYIFMVYPRGVIPPGTLWAVFIEILIDSARMIETLSLLIFTPVDSLGFFRILFFSPLFAIWGRGGGGWKKNRGFAGAPAGVASEKGGGRWRSSRSTSPVQPSSSGQRWAWANIRMRCKNRSEPGRV